MLKKHLLTLIKTLINEINQDDWQFINTVAVLKEVGYYDFLNNLSVENKAKLTRELTHHLNTGLTTALVSVNLNDTEKVKSAILGAQQRFNWLIRTLTEE